MDAFLARLKDWLELIGILGAWIAALWGWSVRQNKRRDKALRDDFKREIDGVGARVNGLEVSVGQHETALDKIESEQRTAAADRQRLFADVAEFRSEVAGLRKSFEMKESENTKLLTDIQVSLGKLDTKIGFLLADRVTK